MKPRILIPATLFVVALIITNNVIAADFCVSSSAEFQAALTTAGNNAEADHIKLKIGSYDAPNEGFHFGFGNQDSEFFKLEISGGWYGSGPELCTQHTLNSPSNTVLDGGDNNQILSLLPSNLTDIVITDIHFMHGFIDQNQGGGALLINASSLPEIYTGRIIIERNIFSHNYGDFGAVYIASSSGTVDVRNNLFAFNATDATGTAAFTYWPAADPDGSLYFSNNTVVENTNNSNDTEAASGVAVFAQANAVIFIGNNIIWGNESNDLRINGDTGTFQNIGIRNSNIGSKHIMIHLDVDVDNISVDPVFQNSGSLNYSLHQNSSLINQGYNSPGASISNSGGVVWYMGDLDVVGKPRVYDTTIDIGAFEFYPDTIFVNGYE